MINRKKDLKIVKKKWHDLTLTITGLILFLLILFSIVLRRFVDLPTNDLITLILTLLLTASFLAGAILRIKSNSVYEAFYSSYLASILTVFTIIYVLAFLKNVESQIFWNTIVGIYIMVYLYTLAVKKYSKKAWFILLSYCFTALVTIFVFAYLYWIMSILGLGFLQYKECMVIDPLLKSENWFYFSSSTFYTLGYGDICPIMSLPRLASQIEVALGVLINTILIGLVFWKVREKSLEKTE